MKLILDNVSIKFSTFSSGSAVPDSASDTESVTPAENAVKETVAAEDKSDQPIDNEEDPADEDESSEDESEDSSEPSEDEDEPVEDTEEASEDTEEPMEDAEEDSKDTAEPEENEGAYSINRETNLNL